MSVFSKWQREKGTSIKSTIGFAQCISHTHGNMNSRKKYRGKCLRERKLGGIQRKGGGNTSVIPYVEGERNNLDSIGTRSTDVYNYRNARKRGITRGPEKGEKIRLLHASLTVI